MEDSEVVSLKDRIRTIAKLWIRNTVSNSCEAIRDSELEDMWEWKPTLAGEHFMKENEALFKFVACSDFGLFTNIEDTHCIKMRESMNYLYSFIHSFADKSMNEIIEAGEELFSKIVITPIEEVKREDEDSEEEIITHQPSLLVRRNELVASQFVDDENDEVYDAWTWNTLIKSVILKEIISSSNISNSLTNVCSKLCNISSTYSKNLIINLFKELRGLYFKAISSTSPLDFDFNKKVEVLGIFSRRSSHEIRSLIRDENVKELGRRIRSSVRITEESNINVETDADTIFSMWLISEHFKANSKIPYILQKLFDKINKDQVIEDSNEKLNEATVNAIKFLDNPSMYEFLNESFSTVMLQNSLFTIGMNQNSIEVFLKTKKKFFEENILKNFGQLIIANKNIHFIEFCETYSKLAKKSTQLSSKLLNSEIAKTEDYSVYNQRDIETDYIVKKSIDLWKEKYEKDLFDQSVCGIWFRLIPKSNQIKTLYVKSFEKDLVERLARHHSKFIDFGNENKPWVKYKYEKLKKQGRKIKKNIDISEGKINGFSVCYNCFNTFRGNKGNSHAITKKREQKYDRQSIKSIDFDFSSEPNCIYRISFKYKDYIQYGILYSYTTSQGSLMTSTLYRDMRQNLNNGQVSYIKFKKKLTTLTTLATEDIESVIKWLRIHNHLSKVHQTIYECEEIRKELEVSDSMNQINEDNYIVINPDVIDREFQENEAIEKIGKQFLFKKDMPYTIETQNEARSKLYKSFKSVIFYNDQYLEEKLFVHLFPTGTGGFNSTFSKCMPLIQYARMRLLAAYTDKFRTDNKYILFLYDWLRKKRIYQVNNGVNIIKLTEVNKELIKEMYEQKETSDFDYYEKFGSRLFNNIKHSMEYKAERFYEIQALMQKFGKPDLFVTVRFNIFDEEIFKYIREVFNVTENEIINFNSHPVGYALYYKTKCAFIRSLFNPNNELPSVFGRIKAYADTLEYTKNGTPHLHFLLWLHDDDKYMASVEGNSLVFARRRNPRGIYDVTLNKLIEEHQMHKCLDWKCHMKKNGKPTNYWLNGFPFEPWSRDHSKYERSTIYYARGEEDINVVPYNPEFLKLMKCSTNVQIVNSENVAVYMSKYITVTRKDFIRMNCKKEETKFEKVNPVETYLKERRITIIEASMELLQSHSYCIYPKLYNLKIRLPNERMLRLLPFNHLRSILNLEWNNESEETEDTEDNEESENESDEEEKQLEKVLAPSIWENYMARSDKLEDITFIEMISKYQWWGNEKKIPNRCRITNENLFFEQWSFQQLESFRAVEDEKYDDYEESNQMKELRREQKKICLDDRTQLAKYCYTMKTPKIVNTLRRNYRNKDELFWFELIITHIPFRSFWELLRFDGRTYESFQEVWIARGMLQLIPIVDQEEYSYEKLDRKLNGFVDGKMVMSISEFKQTVANIWKTIEISSDNDVINERFRICSIDYAQKFATLYREIKRNELIIEKKDLTISYKRELSEGIIYKSNYYKEYWYKSVRGEEINENEDMWAKIFKSFKRFEPRITLKLNEELDSFLINYNSDHFFSRSQKRAINYLLKNLFSKSRNCFYITGNAGTGKSFLLRQLVNLLENVLNLNVLVCASTGTAAKNINGTTVHRAFSINPTNVASIWLPGSMNFQSLKKRDVVIIDEISMISEDIIQVIDLTLRSTQMYNKKDLENCTLPFGGKMIILFGDLLQIPWVGEQKIGESIRKLNPIHKSDSFKNFEWIFLYDQMRQADDQEYSFVWDELSKGLSTEETRLWLQKRICKDGEGSGKKKDKMLTSYYHDTNIKNTQDWEIASNRDILIVAADNFIKNRHNQVKLEALFKPEEIKTFKAHYYIKGQKSTGDTLRLNPHYFFYDDHTYEETINLAVGCKAICNINISIKEGLTNGTIGKIVAIHDDILEFEYYFRETRRIAYITRHYQDCTIPTMDVSRGQFPVNLAYCLTMHKCQGQTLEGVVIDCENIFAPGLFYSTIARCKDSQNIHIKRLIPSKHIICDQEVVELINAKEGDFADNFDRKYEDLPDITGVINHYLFILRESRISWWVIKDYLEDRIKEEQDMYYELSKEELDEGFNWFDTLYNKLHIREEEMFTAYRNYGSDEEIDWRNSQIVSYEEQISDLFRRMYSVNEEDINEEVANIEVIDASNEEREERWRERMHDFYSNYSFPWVHWVPEMKGFDCFILLFNICIYQKLTNVEIYNEFEYGRNEDDLIKDLNSSLVNLQGIDPLKEFASSSVCQRLNGVIAPLMMKLKEDDYIVDVLNFLNKDDGLFTIRVNWFYDCKRRCRKGDYENMTNETKSMSYLLIESDVFNNRKKRTMCIDESILFNTQFEVLSKNCEKWRFNLQTDRVCLVQEPKYLFIVNQQENANCRRYKDFEVEQNITINGNIYADKKLNKLQGSNSFDYKLIGIIQQNYQANYMVHLKMNVDDEEVWYEYSSKKNGSNFIEPIHDLDPKIIYSPSFENGLMWPVIFLYVKNE